MYIKITRHAQDRIDNRLHGIVSQSDVVHTVKRYSREIKESGMENIHVVIKVLPRPIVKSGSRGDIVVAAVTCRGEVKTVMLRNRAQLKNQYKLD